MTLEGAVLREQNVTFAIVVVKPHVVDNTSISEELQGRLDDHAGLRAAFGALFYVSSSEQAKTRLARVEKCVPMVLSGREFNEPPD